MHYKNVYKTITDQPTANLLKSLLQKLNYQEIEFLAKIDDNYQKYTQEDWNKIVEWAENHCKRKEIYSILMPNKHFPKELAMNMLRKTSYDYLIFERDDLSSKDIQLFIKNSGIKRTKEILLDMDIRIHNNAIDSFCELNNTTLKKLQYTPFMRLNKKCHTYKELNEIIEKSNNNEDLMTMLASNKNLSDAERDTYFSIAYVPERLQYLTQNMANEVYAAMTYLIHEQPIEEVDINIRHNAFQSLQRFIYNNTLSSAHYKDFANRQKTNSYAVFEPVCRYLAQTSRDTNLLPILMNIQQECKYDALKNPAFDFNCLSIGDKVWFIGDNNKDRIDLNRKKFALRALMNITGCIKAGDPARCIRYLTQTPQDNVLIKTIIMSPSTKSSTISHIRNSWIPTLKDENEKQDFLNLIDIAEKIDWARLSTTQAQFIAHQVLKENLKNDPKVMYDVDKQNEDFKRALTYKEYLESHKEVDEMGISFAAGEWTEFEEFRKTICFKYIGNQDILKLMHKVSTRVNVESDFSRFTHKWSQYFKKDNHKTVLDMEKLYKLNKLSLLSKQFKDDILRKSYENSYFAERMYNLFKEGFIEQQIRVENNRMLIENLYNFEQVYNKLEQITYKQYFDRGEISTQEYKEFCDRFDILCRIPKEKENGEER